MANADGTWNIVVATPIGRQERSTCTLTLDGDISGKAKAGPFPASKVTGNRA